MHFIKFRLCLFFGFGLFAVGKALLRRSRFLLRKIGRRRFPYGNVGNGRTGYAVFGGRDFRIDGEIRPVQPVEREEQTDVSDIDEQYVEQVDIAHKPAELYQPGNFYGQGIDLRKRIVGADIACGALLHCARHIKIVENKVTSVRSRPACGHRRNESACEGSDYYDYEIIDKGGYAVLYFKAVVSERGRQHAQRKQQAVRKAEIQYRITAKDTVVAHLVFAEVDKDGQRPHRMHEERNGIQKFLFEYDRSRRHIDAYIADKERQTSPYGAVYVITVAHKHAVLAVVLQKQAHGDCRKVLVLRGAAFTL